MFWGPCNAPKTKHSYGDPIGPHAAPQQQLEHQPPHNRLFGSAIPVTPFWYTVSLMMAASAAVVFAVEAADFVPDAAHHDRPRGLHDHMTCRVCHKVGACWYVKSKNNKRRPRHGWRCTLCDFSALSESHAAKRKVN